MKNKILKIAALLVVIICFGCSNQTEIAQTLPPTLEDPGTTVEDRSGEDIYMPGEVLIVLYDQFEPVNGEEYFSSYDLEAVREKKYPWGTLHRMKITDGTSVDQMCDTLSKLPAVKFAEPNYYLHFADVPYTPNDPMWEWDGDPDDDPRSNIYEQWGPSKLGANIVWNDTKGDEDIIVAIVDTGIRRTHEDLIDNVWINEDEVPIDNGVDDDNNGWIDDWWGWDTFEGNNNPMDPNGGNHWHGTGCAGVVAATQDNDLGISGIAPGVQVMAIRADMNDGPTCVDSVVEAWDYAKVNGADIISMSFYVVYPTEVLETAAYACWDDGNGPIMMASCGNANNQDVHEPAGYDCVICVSATVPFTVSGVPADERRIAKNWGGWWWGSSYGSHVNIAGYGERTYSTFGSGDDQYWDGVNHWFFNGTSCACPTAAGVMALILSAHPGEENQWYWDRIEDTADDLHDPGFDIHTGYGRVNALRAVYGSDRYSSYEDSNGFVPLDGEATSPEPELFDSIHDFPTSPFHDTTDLYKLWSDYDGEMTIDLDIFTWGENLDMALYSDLSMTNLIAETTLENHADSSFESITTYIDGETWYYLDVHSPSEGSSTTYGLDVTHVHNTLYITGGPVWSSPVVPGEDVAVLAIDFDVTFDANLDSLDFSTSYDGSSDTWGMFSLYRDTNLNGIFDDTDLMLSAEPAFDGTTCEFDDLSQFFDSTQTMIVFLVVRLNDSMTDGSSFTVSLDSSDDVGIDELVEFDDSALPLSTGSVLIEL